MSVLDITRGESQFSSTLAAEVEALLPETKQGVNILTEGQIGHYLSADEVLRGHVCGRVVRLLGFQLRRKGYNAVGYSNQNFDAEGIYPTPDHSIVVVKTPEHDDDVVVDAAYLQFLSGLFLEKEHVPEEEALVFPLSYAGIVTSGLVKLRNEKLERHPNPQLLKNTSELFRLGDDELRNYYSKIWNVGAYTPIAGGLELDLETYRNNLDSVSGPTRRVIEALKLDTK